MPEPWETNVTPNSVTVGGRSIEPTGGHIRRDMQSHERDGTVDTDKIDTYVKVASDRSYGRCPIGTGQGADGLRALRDLFRLGGHLLASKFAVNNCASVVCPSLPPGRYTGMLPM